MVDNRPEHSLVDHGKVDKKSYNKLVKILESQYSPKPSVIMQRFHLNSRVCAHGESIASYITTLQELALHCKYGDKPSEKLWDQLVCSMNHKGIQ